MGNKPSCSIIDLHVPNTFPFLYLPHFCFSSNKCLLGFCWSVAASLAVLVPRSPVPLCVKDSFPLCHQVQKLSSLRMWPALRRLKVEFSLSQQSWTNSSKQQNSGTSTVAFIPWGFAVCFCKWWIKPLRFAVSCDYLDRGLLETEIPLPAGRTLQSHLQSSFLPLMHWTQGSGVLLHGPWKCTDCSIKLILEVLMFVLVDDHNVLKTPSFIIASDFRLFLNQEHEIVLLSSTHLLPEHWQSCSSTFSDITHGGCVA